MVNMTTRVVRRLSGSSLWSWILEYLRQQPKDRRFSALVLRFIKDRTAAILLVEAGLQASAWVSVGVDVGDIVEVKLEWSHPLDDALFLLRRFKDCKGLIEFGGSCLKVGNK